jgi:hypothetical protein
MNNMEFSGERHVAVSDQVLAVLDFHFHYGAGHIQSERDLIEQIGPLPVSFQPFIVMAGLAPDTRDASPSLTRT